MKIGMIGLGRMGEGMSRRLIAAGHEVHGYRNNYKKAEEQFENLLTLIELELKVVKYRTVA